MGTNSLENKYWVVKNNKVLIISFYFPPTNTIGAVRMGKFVKYLAEFGWDPVILTANNCAGNTWNITSGI